MTASPSSEIIFNPFAPGFAEDPYPHYAALRENAPVQDHPAGFWLLTRYEHVAALLRTPGLSVESRERTGPMLSIRRAEADRPQLRRLISGTLTPRRVEALRPRITELVDGMLDAVARAGQADMVEAVAYPLPFTVISEMLGTPSAEHTRIRDLTAIVTRALEPVNDPEVATAITAADSELAGIAAEVIAWKRKKPGDDMLSALINAEDDGHVLTDDELVAQTLLLYVAGHETTVNLLAGGTLALLRHPGEMELLCRNPGLVTNAVEELLRYTSPSQLSRRITVEPMTVDGMTIPAGAFVIASLASANRDERCFGPDAGQLRLGRENARQHVAFGAGPHHCLGASLARLEAAVAFERISMRLPGLSLDGEVAWNGRMNLRGPARLPVSAV